MKFGIHGLNNATLLVGASIRPVNAIHSFIETKADLAFCILAVMGKSILSKNVNLDLITALIAFALTVLPPMEMLVTSA
jgi:hypothetical protein